MTRALASRAIVRRSVIAGLGALIAVPALWASGLFRKLSPAEIEAAYAVPLSPPDRPLRVFHLGHSLVGRDMPAMLAQLAGAGHRYESQLGWGTALKQHWEPGETINGFEVENDHPRYRDAKGAIASGEYDALVLTEMVEIRDAIRYFDSGSYLNRWADYTRDVAPRTRIYLYETWTDLDHPEGWLNRIDTDLAAHWEGDILHHDLARTEGPPVYVIPAGQVMAEFVRRIEARGGLGNVPDRTALFARTPSGDLDTIHFSDLGAYLVALTHYAVLYHRSPVGLPNRLMRADGSAATAPDEKVARLMQETVWDVVTGYAKTGVAG